MNNKIVGYTSGAFDLFHVGHLRLLEACKNRCDNLTVAVSTDKLVKDYKGRKPIIPFNEREEIIRGLRCVDSVIAQNSLDKFRAWEKLKYDILFVGDDWFGTESWKDYEKKLKKRGVVVVYFPYTKGISTTKIRKKLR